MLQVVRANQKHTRKANQTLGLGRTPQLLEKSQDKHLRDEPACSEGVNRAVPCTTHAKEIAAHSGSC